MNKHLKWAGNIWMGTSVENEDYISRIDLLRRTSAKIKFLSLEPLLGKLRNLNLKKIDWVIVGGESGFKARPMKPEWVLDILKQRKQADVLFFFSYEHGSAVHVLMGAGAHAASSYAREDDSSR